VRWFWTRWFAHDGVRLNSAILPHLLGRTEQMYLRESSTSIPYLCGLKVPFYIYVGRKIGSPPIGSPF